MWERLAYDAYRYGPDERLEEYVGAGTCHAGIAGAASADPPEVVLRLGVKGSDRKAIDRFGSELVPLVTSGPPGVTGFAGGRAKADGVIGSLEFQAQPRFYFNFVPDERYGTSASCPWWAPAASSTCSGRRCPPATPSG